MFNRTRELLLANGLRQEEVDIFATDTILSRYTEPHRFYHDIRHINGILERLLKETLDHASRRLLAYTAVYHDIFHNPLAPLSERESARIFEGVTLYSDKESIMSKPDMAFITSCIIQTEGYSNPNMMGGEMELFRELDLHLLKGSYEQAVEATDRVAKEYQFVPTPLFKELRTKILSDIGGLLPDERARAIKCTEYFTPDTIVLVGDFRRLTLAHLHDIAKYNKQCSKLVIAKRPTFQKDKNDWKAIDPIYETNISYRANRAGLTQLHSDVSQHRFHEKLRDDLLGLRLLRDQLPVFEVVLFTSTEEDLLKHYSRFGPATIKYLEPNIMSAYDNASKGTLLPFNYLG